jgi:amphi-Trp domain-containing protein
MKFARNDLKVEGAAPVAHVVAYLEQLAQALRAGTAHVRQGDQQIVLGPSDIVGFSLAASDRGKRQSVALELTWRKRNIPATELDLQIGSDAAASHSTEATEVTTSPALADEASVLTGAPGTDTDSGKGEAREGEKL